MIDLEELLKDVPVHYHKPFADFVQTGKLQPDFERYLNDKSSVAAQAAFDRVLDAQAEAFTELNQALDRKSAEAEPVTAVSSPSGVAEQITSLNRALSTAPDRPRVQEEIRALVAPEELLHLANILEATANRPGANSAASFVGGK